jgi:hypothetical protein
MRRAALDLTTTACPPPPKPPASKPAAAPPVAIAPPALQHPQLRVGAHRLSAFSPRAQARSPRGGRRVSLRLFGATNLRVEVTVRH